MLREHRKERERKNKREVLPDIAVGGTGGGEKVDYTM